MVIGSFCGGSVARKMGREFGGKHINNGEYMGGVGIQEREYRGETR